MRALRSISLVLLVSLVPIAPAIARADAASEQAAALKTKGDAAMDALDYAGAVAAYTEAYALAKNPALLYNKGRALQALGRFPEALVELERFRDDAPAELKAKVPKLDELIAEVRAKVSTLTITCPVAGARVVVRDRVVGSTPIDKPLALVAGKATLEVSVDGYLPFTREIDLPGGGALTVDVALVKKAQSAQLVIASPVAGAAVLVDGKPVGNVPVDVSVPVGAHVVIVRHDGYDEATTRAELAAGERRALTIELTKQASLTTKWWFWTGVGVVVVAGVGITAALLTEKSPSSGDGFSPSRTTGPLLRF